MRIKFNSLWQALKTRMTGIQISRSDERAIRQSQLPEVREWSRYHLHALRERQRLFDVYLYDLRLRVAARSSRSPNQPPDP